MGAGEDGDTDGVGVFLDGRFDDLLWGLVEARVDNPSRRRGGRGRLSWPLSCPSRPTFATTTLIVRATVNLF